MFQAKQLSFGKYTKHIISNGEASISVVPAYGASLQEAHFPLKSGISNIIDGCLSYEELVKNEAYKGANLFPFPNRIDHGKYTIDGNDYSFPQNEPGSTNALHGFIFDKKFEVIEEVLCEDYGSIDLEYHYDGDFQYFPFPFSMFISYKLSANQLEISYQVKAIGDQKMPFGLGWHPYFKFGNSKVESISLKMPESKKYELNELSIPTGKIIDFDDFNREQKIDRTTLDDCFELIEKSGNAECTLSHPDYGKITLKQPADIFPYLQVYTPPHRNSIALEPMTCAIDAFNNGNGLQFLLPNEEFNATIVVHVK